MLLENMFEIGWIAFLNCGESDRLLMYLQVCN
jgi:hypothetical protein